jgi:hypothetical protein
LTTNNNLMNLAQLSGCAFYYLELKFGKEYATMEMTKSEQIRAGLQKSFQSGSSAKASTVCYGYRLSSSGELVVYPTEAVIVFYIFERFEAGDSYGKISSALADMEIVSPSGKAVWSRETISKLLANEKYMGDVILGKTQVVDGVQTKSFDAGSQVHMKNHHPAIIPRELFDAVQKERHRRSKRRVTAQQMIRNLIQ